MNSRLIDSTELRQRTTLAMHIVVSHHASCGTPLDKAQMALLQEALERRVGLALERTDLSEVHFGWTWKEAAERIALRIALAIVKAHKKDLSRSSRGSANVFPAVERKSSSTPRGALQASFGR